MFEPNRNLGQNFLTDFHVASIMVDALDIQQNDTIVEIGPGLGAITIQLANTLTSSESKIYVVEVDERFIPKLNQMLKEHLNTQVVFANFLDWLPMINIQDKFKILGAIPFNITTPIVNTILHLQNQPETCVLMVQDEVAKKLTAAPPDSSFWSVFVQSFYDVEYLGSVEKEKFDPAPSFNGGIVKLNKKQTTEITFDQLQKYEGFLHRGFSNPRKMLNKIFTEEEIQKINFNGSDRAENISAQHWTEAFKKLLL